MLSYPVRRVLCICRWDHLLLLQSMAQRVPLRVIAGRLKPNRGEVFEKVYGELNVALVRLIDIATGFVALCQTERDADILLGEVASGVLSGINLETRVPPQYAAQRSVICRRLDPWVGEHESADIGSEIERMNSWAKVREVIKFKDYTHVFKVTFMEASMAQRATEDGILAFNTRIAGEQIEREPYINILMCFKCFALESHITKKCPSREEKICSECSSTSHTWRECTAVSKCCVNCGGGHRTMAMSCPKKREIIANRRKEMTEQREEKSLKTYSDAVRKVVKENEGNKVMLQVEPGAPMELLACILHAHVINIAVPGSFSRELNSMLKANGIKEMVFPDNPPSGKLLNVTNFMTEHARQGSEGEASGGPAPQQVVRDPPLKKSGWGASVGEYGEWEMESEASCATALDDNERPRPRETIVTKRVTQFEKEKAPTPRTYSGPRLDPGRPSAGTGDCPYSASELNLKIYAPENKGFPQKKESKTIADGVSKGIYKWDYDFPLEEAIVQRALMAGQIKVVKENCIILAREVFNKRRNGKARSPASRDRRPSFKDNI